MPIITIFSQKGGTGKTTLSIALYHAFQRSEVKTLLIDLDIQKSIINIKNTLESDWPVIDSLDIKQIENNTISIIDTVPDFQKSRKAIATADLILIPLRPSPVDAITTLQTVSAIQELKDPPSIYVVINATIAGTQYNTEVRDLLTKNKINVLKTEIGNRLDFARSLLDTGNIYDTRNTKAKSEINRLCLEIYGKLVN